MGKRFLLHYLLIVCYYIFVIVTNVANAQVSAISDDVCNCTPILECNWSQNSLKNLTRMSKDDPKRDGKIDLIARNMCDIKKRTVFCCGSEQTPKELTKQNFIEDLLTSSTDKIIDVAGVQATTISWFKGSSFCQLDLYKDTTMKSMPFASFSKDAKRVRITRKKPKSFKITSTSDTKCCWRIKKKGKLIRTLKNDGKTSLFSRLEGVRPPFVVKSCQKKI